METGIWVAQVILSALFIAAGAFKAIKTKAELASQMAWVEDFSPLMVKFIGVVEVLGGLGLILPAITGIAKFLVPLAAAGLAIIMVGAAIVHARRGERQLVGPNLMLFGLAAFVAITRYGPYAL